MKILTRSKVEADNVKADIRIYETPEEYVPIYEIEPPKVDIATKAVLDNIREKLVETVQVKLSEITDPRAMGDIKKRFMDKAVEIITKEFPKITKPEQLSLSGRLVHEMLGLGEFELLLSDPDLEEIVINSSTGPAWVYHKRLGWLKTNIIVPSEEQIYNYASIIGRKVGRQISNLAPLMDAHLLTGDRVNATLFPISSSGNTITIRKFARDPWTIIHFLDPEYKTLNYEIAGLLWLCMEYELSIIATGGTASGKTSMLNAMMTFIPPNHRIISIEDTRELMLPEYLHWIPMTTRLPNPEGKGEVTMLDLMINSLRMRPDRIILGEIRRQKEAEVLFEAMHTGHSVYSTLHADRADQVKGRLVNPPISLPQEMLEALHLIVVQFRHRKLRIRRTLEVAEVIPTTTSTGDISISMNVLYKWDPRTDKIKPKNRSKRIFSEIQLHTGMTDKEIGDDLKEKESILLWMFKNKVSTLDTVGKVVAEYYKDPDYVLNVAKKNKKPSEILTEKLMKELKGR